MPDQGYSTSALLTKEIGKNFRIAIVNTQWHEKYIQILTESCVQTLKNYGVNADHIAIYTVPGSFELISAGKMITAAEKFDVVICFGVLIKGETAHFEYICQGLSYGLTQLNASQNIPLIFGVITAFSEDQVIDRCGGKHGNKGIEAAEAALQMALLSKNI